MLIGLVIVLQWLVYCESKPDLVCSAGPSGLQLSLTSQKNENGNWVTKVNLERGGARGLASVIETDPWAIDVNSNTKFCEGVGSLRTSLTITAPTPNVRADYELFPGAGYYKFHTDVTTWPLARQICVGEDAHLMIINSEKESVIATTLFSRHPTISGATHNNFAWIGVEKKDDKYWTIFGDSLNSTGFLRWGGDQPNGGNENCLLVERTTGALYDIVCEWKVAFICEHEL